MKACRPLICAVSLAAFMALSACGNHDNNPNSTPVPATTPPPAMSAATPYNAQPADRSTIPPASGTAMMPPTNNSMTEPAPANASTAGR